MRTRREIDALADELGALPSVTEKVDRLIAILRRLDAHELARGAWALKGGTALNLFHFELPRLSVDIDLNFLGCVDVQELAAERQRFERVLEQVCLLEGCEVRRTPHAHAGGKFRLRYESAFGGAGNLELDMNYVSRVPLFAPERRTASVATFGDGIAVPTTSLAELAAGKFAALLDRGLPRDFYDAAGLRRSYPGLLADPGFRTAFACAVGSSRADLRTSTRVAHLTAREVEQSLIPVLRARGRRPVAKEVCEQLEDQITSAIPELLHWSDAERVFLARLLDEGSLEPEHLTRDPDLRDRIAAQPMLQWKLRHVRRRLGLDA